MKIFICSDRWRTRKGALMLTRRILMFPLKSCRINTPNFLILFMEFNCIMVDGSYWAIPGLIHVNSHDLKRPNNFYQSQMVFHGKMALSEMRTPFSCSTFPDSIRCLNSPTGLKQKDVLEMFAFFYLGFHFLLQTICTMSAQIFKFSSSKMSFMTLPIFL